MMNNIWKTTQRKDMCHFKALAEDMGSRIFSIDDQATIKYASDLLKNGDVIAVPTDTVYGLACNANDPLAIQKVYTIKSREKLKPIAICVANIASIRHWGIADHLEDELLKCLLPGPVTIVLKKSKHLDNPYINPGIDKIGIRIPNYKFIRDLCFQFKFPLALTSANKSSEKSTLHIDEFKELWPCLGAIFNGGPVGLSEANRSASTVIDLSTVGEYKIIREGIAISSTINTMNRFSIRSAN